MRRLASHPLRRLRGKVEWLKKAQGDYFSKLVEGQIDDDYIKSRISVGHTHGRIGLLPSWYIGAFCNYVMSSLRRIDVDESLSAERRSAAIGSLIRRVFFDMSVSTDAFLESLFESMAASDERNQNILAVNSVLQPLLESTTADEALRLALDTVREAFGWDYGSFWRRDFEKEELRFELESGSVSQEFREVTRRSSFKKGVGVSGRTWQRGEILVVGDLGTVTDCVRAPVAMRAGVQSGVCVPIIIAGEVIGTMDFFALKQFDVGEGRLDALKNVGHLVSSTLARLRDRDRFNASLSELATELGAVSGNLKETTANQSSSAQELATSVSQVTTTLSELRQASADALEKAEAVIVQAQHSVETSAEGSKAVEAAVEAMREITGSVEEISDRVLTLSEQTAQIGDIISSVNEIAAQSKLLALNAAIEAARAGEHGKGFAVVATEIRSLSDQSKDATGQVRDILGEIQGGTSSAVDSARDGTVRVATGMELAERSGRNINELGETIERSAESARLIANAARQQNAGIEQVADAMAAISQVSQNTVAVVRQTDDAAQQLVNLSAKIAELMRELGTREGNGAGR